MKAIVLCGGQGTRLREETEYRPKPLIEVGGRPILWHIMKIFAHHGIKDFVLCLGYRGQMIKEYFLNYEAMNKDFSIRLGAPNHIDYHGSHDEQDFRVTLADTGQHAMTGSRIKQIEKYVEDDELVLVTYGDGLSDVDLTAVLRFHRSHGRLATVTATRPSSRFGILDLDAASSVQRFVEKPQEAGWANAGFFVLDRRAFSYISADESCTFEREPLERLAADGELMAYQHDGFFFAMDTYREYQVLNELWSSGKAPWAVWSRSHVA